MKEFVKLALPETGIFAIGIRPHSEICALETHDFPNAAYWKAWLNFRETAKLLWRKTPRTEELSELAELVGRYELADALQGHLKRKGVSLDRGCIPFAAPLDRMAEFLGVEPPSALWCSNQIQAWASEQNFQLQQICLPDSEWPQAHALLQCYQGEADLWRFLSAWEALTEHSQKNFQLSFAHGG